LSVQEMQIVDTPGTNVILDRQQRLTEEYVPRADLILFVMSADRPFSESEVLTFRAALVFLQIRHRCCCHLNPNAWLVPPQSE
jgi:hypothetical protein